MMGGMVVIRGDDDTEFVGESSCWLDMVDWVLFFCPPLLLSLGERDRIFYIEWKE